MIHDLFSAGDRYALLGLLGAGSFGAVYKAHDRWWDRDVALKILTRSEPEALQRFKREFRQLRELRDPHLVALHALGRAGEFWYVAMELKEGGSLAQLLAGARGSPAAIIEAPTPSDEDSPAGPPSDPLEGGADGSPLPAPVVLQLARDLLRGLWALHRKGLLHRDIKPSNILLGRDGRACLADFGLVTPTTAPRSPSRVVGTRAYLAPELLRGEAATPESDIYALGKVLGQAVTGQALPGELPPLDLPPELDALEELRLRMISADPGERPTCEEALALLGAPLPPQAQAGGAGPTRGRAPSPTPALTGRLGESQRLGRAWLKVRRGQPWIVKVMGEAGVGKSQLIHSFLQERLDEGGPLLYGRCGEGEMMPYQVFDALVDDLADVLEALPEPLQRQIAPPEHAALLDMFPVLGRLGGWEEAAPATADADPPRRRDKAFDGLKWVLTQLCHRRPVVIAIDDLHRVDPNSLALLHHLLAPPRPAALWLVCSRPEPVGGAEEGQEAQTPHLREADEVVELAALSPGASLELARACLPAELADTTAEQIARESGGSPFLISLLAALRVSLPRDVPMPSGGALSPTLSLRSLIQSLAALPHAATFCLRLVATATRPLPATLLRRCGQLTPDEFFHAVDELCQRRLARAWTSEGEEIVECFHDRVRDEVLALMGDQVRTYHLSLAEASQQEAPPAHARAMTHFAAAGLPGRAIPHCLEGARVAQAALAFDREAWFYEWYLRLTDGAEGGPLTSGEAHQARAHALRRAGRGEAAGEAFLAAAQRSVGQRAEVALVLAAREFNQVGLYDRGLEALGPALARAGLTLPRSRLEAAARLLLARLRLGVMGAGPPLSSPAERPPDGVRRYELLMACAALFPYRFVFRVLFGSLALATALELGDVDRVSRALLEEMVYLANRQAPRAFLRPIPRVEACRALLSTHHSPALEARIAFCDGVAATATGRWAEALRHFEVFRAANLHYDVAGHQSRAEAALLEGISAHRIGDLPRQRLALAQPLAEARAHGSAGELPMLIAYNLLLLAEGRIEEGGRLLEEFNHRRSALEHETASGAMPLRDHPIRATRALYLKDARSGRHHCEQFDRWSRYNLRIGKHFLGMGHSQLRIQGLVLAALVYQDKPARRLRAAAEIAAEVRGQGLAWTWALGTSLLAAVASCQGEKARALALHDEARRCYEQLGQPLFVGMEHIRRGQTEGGPGGLSEIEEGCGQLKVLGVQEPLRLTDALLPLVPGACPEEWTR